MTSNNRFSCNQRAVSSAMNTNERNISSPLYAFLSAIKVGPQSTVDHLFVPLDREVQARNHVPYCGCCLLSTHIHPILGAAFRGQFLLTGMSRSGAAPLPLKPPLLAPDPPGSSLYPTLLPSPKSRLCRCIESGIRGLLILNGDERAAVTVSKEKSVVK